MLSLKRYSGVEAFNSDKKPQPEDLKPPVIIRVGIILTEEEEEILKLGPKITLRRVLNRENFLVKVEKTLAKEKYWRT